MVNNLTRRDWLKRAAGSAALLGFGPQSQLFSCGSASAFGGRSASAAEHFRYSAQPDKQGNIPEKQGNILVVVQLAGGNDSLNTVVPYADDVYARSRPTLRLDGRQVLKINDYLGFHPRLKALARHYEQGSVSIVQAVGYPSPSQGHFESMRIWQTADTKPTHLATGWLGRVCDVLAAASPGALPALFVGSIRQPFTLNAGRAIVPSIGGPGELWLRAPAGLSDSAYIERVEQLASAPRGSDGPLAEHVARMTATACTQVRKIQKVLADSQQPRGYPPIELARHLQTVAQLIRAELGIRIYCVELGGEEPGGFDNHAAQRDNHAALLGQLAESVAAFLDDLRRDRLLERVLLMTYSEFGRTIQENGRRGTDHGSGACMFVAGGKIKGGLLGEHPSLLEKENGGLKHSIDFRRLYATVLRHWLGVDPEAVLGRGYRPLAGLIA